MAMTVRKFLIVTSNLGHPIIKTIQIDYRGSKVHHDMGLEVGTAAGMGMGAARKKGGGVEDMGMAKGGSYVVVELIEDVVEACQGMVLWQSRLGI